MGLEASWDKGHHALGYEVDQGEEGHGGRALQELRSQQGPAGTSGGMEYDSQRRRLRRAPRSRAEAVCDIDAKGSTG